MYRHTELHTWAGLLFALFVVCLIPADGFAQAEEREKAEITERQVELNEDGVRAIIDGDYTKAVALLSESLAYGKANVTYLNLGRAYQKKGDCKKAREILEKALIAPVVSDPPPRIIDKQANKYLAELDETCPKDTAPPATSEQAGGEGTTESEKAETSDGSETAEKARESEPTDEKTVADQDDSQGEDASSDASTDAPNGQDVQMAKTSVDTDTGGSNALGWVAIGSGAALAGGGVVLHVLAQDKRNEIRGADVNEGSQADVIQYDDQQAQQLQDEANTFDTIGLGAGIAGAALIGVGTVALLTNDSGESAFRLRVGPDRAMAVAKWTF